MVQLIPLRDLHATSACAPPPRPAHHVKPIEFVADVLSIDTSEKESLLTVLKCGGNCMLPQQI